MSKLVRELRRVADEVFPFAQAVSNTGKPEKDNNIGRATVTMRQAADLLEKHDRFIALQKSLIEKLLIQCVLYVPPKTEVSEDIKQLVEQIKQEETL